MGVDAEVLCCLISDDEDLGSVVGVQALLHLPFPHLSSSPPDPF